MKTTAGEWLKLSKIEKQILLRAKQIRNKKAAS